jgi:hypothetical protein
METTEPEVTIKRTCELPGCHVEFTPNDSKQKYCCTSHRNKHIYIKKKSMGTMGNIVDPESAQSEPKQSAQTFTEPKQHRDMAIPSGLNHTALFIIDNLKEQRDDWKAEWKEERDARRKLLTEKEQLEKEIRNLKHEHEIKEIRGEKPSGLNGLMESPAMKELMPSIAPALGEFLMGIAKVGTSKIAGMAPPRVPGAEGLSGVSADIMSATASWLSQVSEPTQQAFMQMMTPIMGMDEQTAMYYISNIINLIQHGSTARTGTGY